MEKAAAEAAAKKKALEASAKKQAAKAKAEAASGPQSDLSKCKMVVGKIVQVIGTAGGNRGRRRGRGG